MDGMSLTHNVVMVLAVAFGFTPLWPVSLLLLFLHVSVHLSILDNIDHTLNSNSQIFSHQLSLVVACHILIGVCSTVLLSRIFQFEIFQACVPQSVKFIVVSLSKLKTSSLSVWLLVIHYSVWLGGLPRSFRFLIHSMTKHFLENKDNILGSKK